MPPDARLTMIVSPASKLLRAETALSCAVTPDA
jgi:hypothetical protein